LNQTTFIKFNIFLKTNQESAKYFKSSLLDQEVIYFSNLLNPHFERFFRFTKIFINLEFSKFKSILLFGYFTTQLSLNLEYRKFSI
jgi:hypothetical protein